MFACSYSFFSLISPYGRYDTRFVGFGWNKISHITQLANLGLQFYVLPDVFIVHTPHAPSSSLFQFRASDEYKKCLLELKAEWAKELQDAKPAASSLAPGRATTESPVQAFLRRKAERQKARIDALG